MRRLRGGSRTAEIARLLGVRKRDKKNGRMVVCGVEPLERRAMLAAGDVLANHYTAGSTGEDLNETVLTPANVNSASFGKVFTTTLDGQVYAQILAVANVNITRRVARAPQCSVRGHDA